MTNATYQMRINEKLSFKQVKDKLKSKIMGTINDNLVHMEDYIPQNFILDLMID